MTPARISWVGFFLWLAACGAGRPSGTQGDGGAGGPDSAPLESFTSTVIAQGAPANAPNLFGGPNDPSIAPSFVYPADGVLVPPNISELEFQFTKAATTTLFELAFESANVHLRIYLPCTPVGTGCGYVLDEPTWKVMSAAAAGTALAVSLRATGMSGGAVGVGVTRQLAFGDEELSGGLYYWASKTQEIDRYDFGRRGQKAEPFYTTTTAGTCVGCHALSRDGTRIAVGLAPVNPAQLRVLDVATKKTLFESASNLFGGGDGSNFQALSPDGAMLLATQGGNLVLHDGMSGAILGSNPAIMTGSMPDWSADGTRVVFSQGANGQCAPPPFMMCFDFPEVSGGSIAMASVSGTAFAAPLTLVTGGGNNYYPSFSPDGEFVAFNRAANGATDGSYDADDAAVWVVPASGGPPVALSAVNDPLGSSWPKFAPFVQHYQGKTIFWLTYSSRRNYALRMSNDGKQKADATVQLWMVAVSPDRLAIAGDSGYPPFWLPFQDLATNNHIAQWTQKVVRQPCGNIDNDPCAPGEMCTDGYCVPATIP